jgi:hypothetical protein
MDVGADGEAPDDTGHHLPVDARAIAARLVRSTPV